MRGAGARHRQGLWAGLLLSCLLLASATLPLGPHGRVLAEYLPSLPCPFQELTGLPCPLCGMTRAFLSMGQMQVGRAMIFNAAGAMLFVFLAAQALLGWAALISNSRWLGFWATRNYWPWLATAVVVCWIIRIAQSLI
ncbi:MAG: DUF2752 domain-containing protein [Pseudomonadota bacterium]